MAKTTKTTTTKIAAKKRVIKKAVKKMAARNIKAAVVVVGFVREDDGTLIVFYKSDCNFKKVSSKLFKSFLELKQSVFNWLRDVPGIFYRG